MHSCELLAKKFGTCITCLGFVAKLLHETSADSNSKVHMSFHCRLPACSGQPMKKAIDLLTLRIHDAIDLLMLRIHDA